MHPTTCNQFAQSFLPGIYLPKNLGFCFDYNLQTHRLMDFDHLSRQACTQIAGRTFHDAEHTCHVMRYFCSATETFVINSGEIIFQANACTYRPCDQQDVFDNFSVRILSCIVGNQKHAAIEEDSLSDRTPSNNRGSIGSMAIFRTNLA